ncbi:MAG TPA: hypothetical protein PKD64_15320 [Pirellulaceae bacterium]|nr:hypothetical protein [Pirellulaceae bacterium]HMO93555.1 hypothetical protein [Pirellulaceae bacterium]
MSEQSETKGRKKVTSGDTVEPVNVIRKGAIAASIWRRQSPSGYAYFDFSLSRSWKSMSSDKTGYSKNFFDRNVPELQEVIEEASRWIANQGQSAQPVDDGTSMVVI